MWWTALINPLGDIVKETLKRVLPPEKMTELERANLEQTLTLQIMNQTVGLVEREFQDRESARALAAKDIEKGNAFTGILAATVRPVWGYLSLVVVAYPYLAGGLGWPSVSIDDSTKDIIQTVIMFYFGGRTVEKVLPMMKGKG